MTAEETIIVTDRRHHGLGYKRISVFTEISVNTIKAFCHRLQVCGADNANNARTTDIASAQTFCRGYGKAIESVPKQKRRQFCSDSSRMKWWNNHQEQIIRDRRLFLNSKDSVLPCVRRHGTGFPRQPARPLFFLKTSPGAAVISRFVGASLFVSLVGKGLLFTI